MTAPPFVTGLRCLLCDAVYPHGDLQTCPRCGAGGILDVEYDYERISAAMTGTVLASRSADQWRYREMLPVPPDAVPPHPVVGWTPVYDLPRLAAEIGAAKLLLKDDGRNPTASFKDRASSVGVMKALEFGYTKIACASTGNAASSLAGMAAAAGLSTYIFVPQAAPEPKVAQLLIFGATVFRVRGSYAEAFELCRQACSRFGWYSRNSGTNPFLVEGKKTAGLEIAEQCAGRLPDWVVVSVGDGCTLGGIGKGLGEMVRLGRIPRMPRLLGVQAEGARPVVDAFTSGTPLVPCEPATVADSIAVGMPRNWRRAIAQIKDSHGAMVAVEDEEILDSMRLTARLGGVFGEPAAVTGIAGLRRALATGLIGRSESTLVVITGSGLKDIRAARQAAGSERSIPPSLVAVEEALGN